MFFQALAYLEPTDKEKKDGKHEEQLFFTGNELIRAKDVQSATFLVVNKVLKEKPELENAVDRLKVVICPFN